MKKRMTLLCVALLLALTGCTTPAEPTRSPEPAQSPAPTYDVTANPPLDERSRTVAVPEFLDGEQQLLYRRALRVYIQLFGGNREDFDHWA